MATLAGIGASFGFYLIGRFITADEFSTVVALIGIITLFNIPLNPIKNFLIKRIIYTGAEFNLLQLNLRLLLAAGITYLAYALASVLLLSNLINVPTELLLIAGLYVFIAFHRPVYFALLESREHFMVSAGFGVLESGLRFAMGLAVAALTGDLALVVIALLCSYLISFGILVVAYHRTSISNTSELHYIGKDKINADIYDAVLFSALASLFIVDTVVMRGVLSAGEAAAYGVANLMGTLVFYGSQNVAKVYFPMALKNMQNNKSFFRISLLVTLVISAIAVTGTLLLGQELASLSIKGSAFLVQNTVFAGAVLVMSVYSYIYLASKYASVVGVRHVAYILVAAAILQPTLILLFAKNISGLIAVQLMLMLGCLVLVWVAITPKLLGKGNE